MCGLCFVLPRFWRCVLGLCTAPPSTTGARSFKSLILAAVPGAARLFWLPSGRCVYCFLSHTCGTLSPQACVQGALLST